MHYEETNMKLGSSTKKDLQIPKMIDEDAKTKNIMVAEEVTKDNKKLKKSLSRLQRRQTVYSQV